MSIHPASFFNTITRYVLGQIVSNNFFIYIGLIHNRLYLQLTPDLGRLPEKVKA